MEKVAKIIDVNAHITNIQAQVVSDNDSAKAIISFENLGYGIITAIKFNAKGYNSFGDEVLVAGKNNFLIIIQDIKVKENFVAEGITVKLPNAEIRKIEIEECQICYANGDISTYDGKKEIEFELEEFTFEEREIRDALRDVFDEKVTYNLLENEHGWICTCGRYNDNGRAKCSMCGHSKEEVRSALSEEGKQKAVEDKKALDLKRNREAEEKAKEKAIAYRKKKIGLGIVVAIVIVLICLISNSIKMSKRETYTSIDSMKSEMQGKWTHYSDDYGLGRDALWQYVIDGDKAYKIYYSDDEMDYGYDIKWNPSNGTFTIGGNTVVVEKGGRAFVEGSDEVYERGGYLPFSDKSSSTYSYESVYSALEFSNLRISHNSSYTICTGTVTNNGSKTYRFVQIKGSFKDSSGTVLDTDSTYAVGSEGLAPGESKTFRMSVHQNNDISTCRVSIYNYA